MNQYESDVLIVGSGLAALMVAYECSSDCHVTIITKSSWQDTNSYKAQGGIAVRQGQDDDTFLTDTLSAGHHQNNATNVNILVSESEAAIKTLNDLGVPFDDQPDGTLHCTKEGGHSRRRILHAGGDATGKHIVTAFKKVLDQSKNVDIFEYMTATELMVKNGLCHGLVAKTEQQTLAAFQAKHTILATGGIGGLYHTTSNSQSLIGDGIAIAHQAGARVSGMEFIQFHPTMLAAGGQAKALISEAVRGEGGILVNQKGQKVMAGVHPQRDLAPRDIVARTLYRAIQKGDQIALDISCVKSFHRRFPNIAQICEAKGIDLAQERIPVSPGAHFLMGGIVTDAYGRTDIKGLYAVGETANTGVHGVNRLASNSLLEACVFARRLAHMIIRRPVSTREKINVDDERSINLDSHPLTTAHDIRTLMEGSAGMIRTEQRLVSALRQLERWLGPFHDVKRTRLSLQQLKIANMLYVSRLIVSAALQRKESLGAHYRGDSTHIYDKTSLVGGRR
ncbi:L-aspartate oxidase [Tuberibacillus sp. Marseille-P3662]|uniref:L-aspartate oxidase n=1 Tax=Tuberibacillus sp. Marseille-P3662 TaxID=1965358 RepID=UPI001593A8FD|nr:L-aspartate oxidase [Tuberibacillus sp. Marseille-P3662]